MSGILYELPRINEKGDFGQKGPNCWYYGSKILLKFHDKLTKDDNNNILKEFKNLHRLRQALSDISDASKSGTKTEALKVLKTKLGAIIAEQNKYIALERGLYYEHRKRIFEHLHPEAPDLLPQLKAAIDTLGKLEEDLRDRSAILIQFVPNAKFFEPGGYKDVYQSPDTLEKTLRENGPLYTGGELTRTFQKDESSADPQTTDVLVGVSGLKPSSAHICVVAGVNGKTVYYKDPNYTHELLSFDFDKFAAAINEPPLAIQCGAKGQMCEHSKLKQGKF